MEQSTFTRFAEKAPELSENKHVAEYIRHLEAHLKTGEAQHIYIPDELAFKAFLELIGHDKLDGSKILAYRYTSLIESHEVTNLNPAFEGDWSVIQVQNYLGDFGMMLEFPNDFKADCIVELDNESVVYYGHQSNSNPVVCEACEGLEEYDPIEGVNRNYSCDHEEDEYDTRNYVAIIKRPDTIEIERIVAHGF